MRGRYEIPPGTPEMRHAQVIVDPTGDPPELCPACGHATLYTFTGSVLHDEGVLELNLITACASDECADDE